jgi:chemotaxis protein histidine kinase CheA
MSSDHDSRESHSKQPSPNMPPKMPPSMPQDMQQKMLEIGARYLQRTTGEIEELRRMAANLSINGADSLKELEILAHRIRGSGAVFGYTTISDLAGEMEMLAVETLRSANIDSQLAERFARHIDALEAEVNTCIAKKP